MKKNIFAGFRYYTEYKDTLKKEAQEKVITFLGKNYNLALCYNIVQDGMQFLDEYLTRGIHFDAILSNVSPSRILRQPVKTQEEAIKRIEEGYSNTIKLLKDIRNKNNPTKKIPIIAYTSANPDFEPFFKAQGIDAFIFKKDVDNWQAEAKSIKSALDSLLG